MHRALTVVCVASVLLIGAAAARASDASSAAAKSDAPQTIWTGSVRYLFQTSEEHVESGDLATSDGVAAPQGGTFANTMRRLATEKATIESRACASNSGCAPMIVGAFQSLDRSDATDASRWLRTCPRGSAESTAMRSALTLKQSFRQASGPAPAQLEVSWDGTRKVWVVDARLLPGGAPLPICDNIASVVESVDPGCDEPAPTPTTTHPTSSTPCVSPAFGEPFTVSAPANASELTGDLTLQSSSMPDQTPSGPGRRRNGAVVIDRKVAYDLRRIARPGPK